MATARLGDLQRGLHFAIQQFFLRVGDIAPNNRQAQPDPLTLVEQEFHAAGTTHSRRSRSAANARHARISSAVRSGKSARISSTDIPPARYSRTSRTVIRSPRMHGWPLRLPGSIVMKRV